MTQKQKQDCFVLKTIYELYLDQMGIEAEVTVTPKTDDEVKEAG